MMCARSWVKGELSTEPNMKLADLEGVFSAMSMEDATADQDISWPVDVAPN